MKTTKPVIPKEPSKTNYVRTYQTKRGWHTINDRRFYFKSSWEEIFARYLQFLKENNEIQEWEYEPQTFWFEQIKRGTRSYLPDFKITRLDSTHYWVEVKGYMDSKSHTKIKRFKKYYPQERLIVITEEKHLTNKNILPHGQQH